MQEELNDLQESFASETTKVEMIPDISRDRREIVTLHIEESFPLYMCSTLDYRAYGIRSFQPVFPRHQVGMKSRH